ncbi:MAG: magnesium/cobalt efflux protein [Gammaproteobacteria bacterium]|nr:magnesium/cobalt efflux protein [Gammaproteobacteria bacterium]
MNDIPIWILFTLVGVLILLSAFFSSSETSMMAINRYRLKHLVKEKNRPARRVTKLLERTDRLLGVILIGNNFTHTLATAIATVIAIRLWSESAVLAVTVFMTIIMIIFAEVMPKTIAAIKPESIAFRASYFLKPLSKILSPLVTLVTFVSNGVTKFFGINLSDVGKEELKPEELRTLLQTSRVPKRQENMLMGIFDMDYLSVNDVMIPKNEIVGIDLKEDLQAIVMNLNNIRYTYIPLYKDTIDNISGFISLNRKADFLSLENPSKTALKTFIEEPLFIPENTSLNKQLANFQTENKRVGLIIDEYGDIEGLVTLTDILEIIVGEITLSSSEKMDIMPQADGSFMIEGNLMIRDINKRINWDLPTEGPKTLSGLILETAQSIPKSNVGIQIGNYRLETVLIKDNVVKMAKVEKIQLDIEEDEDQ